jgi:1-deoxy-D-xylulose-5-phosphate reductoisomerase
MVAARPISIIGSTGYIGRQTLDVVRKSNGKLRVRGLACRSDVDGIAAQAREFGVRSVSVEKEADARRLKRILGRSIRVESGPDAILRSCINEDVTTVVNAAVGVAGFLPTIQALERGKWLLLANKESIVIGGQYVMKTLRDNPLSTLISIDSEHSGIFQCIRGNDGNKIERIYITASGGPFYGKKRGELGNVTPEMALKHPTWAMGRRITVDSATLFNKGFELMEARWFYGVRPNQVEAVVERSSTAHAMVLFEDGSLMAQLAVPDMRLPIQYALYYPERPKNDLKRPTVKGMSLKFEEIDHETFKGPSLARFAMRKGGVMGAVLNGADEAAVELFLDGKIGFLDIGDYVERVMKTWEERHPLGYTTYKDLIAADGIARSEIISMATRLRR